jgi:hypothetical protein
MKMKKLIIIAMAMVLCLGLAGIASATIVNSLHDFSNNAANPSKTNDGLGTSTGQVCVFCHHPHRGADGTNGAGDALLWNMNSVSAASFDVYNGVATFDANSSSAAVTSSAPQSFLCMTCHDGAIAVGSLVQKPRDGTKTTADWWLDAAANGAADLGATLADDHPVNFTYADAVAGGGIQTNVANTVTGASTNEYPLFGGTMQCATCHDVHAGTTTVDSSGIQFMRGDTAASEICVDCHTDK